MILGIFILLVVYVLSIFTVKLLLLSRRTTTLTSYSRLGIFSLGKIGEIVIKLLLAFDLLGGCLGFLVIFGSTALKILQGILGTSISHNFFETWQFYLLISCIVMLPFIFPKTTENLKFASIFGVSAIVIYLIV